MQDQQMEQGQNEEVTIHNETNSTTTAVENAAYKEGESESGTTRLEAFIGQIMNRR
jgi:hypothetical protein